MVDICDLQVGDVIAIDQPFCTAISREARYMFSANCFRENDLDLIPCPNCHSAMFCSPECLSGANEAFHSIECPIVDVLVRAPKLEYEAYLTFRLFILAMKSFKTADELMQFTKDLENREKMYLTWTMNKQRTLLYSHRY